MPSHAAPDDFGPRLNLDQLEVGLGPRRLRLHHPCTLRAGRLYLVVGRSGSGKSSFARALLGFGDLSDPLIPCTGEVTIGDGASDAHVVWSQLGYEPSSRRHIAFLPQAEKLGFLDGLSVTGNLTLFSRLEAERAAQEIDRLAAQFQLAPLPQRLANASGGERIRLSAVRGLLPRSATEGIPSIIIADEPTAGLDPGAAASLARSLNELARNAQSVVIVITHEPEQFLDGDESRALVDQEGVQIVECQFAADTGRNRIASVAGRLRLESIAQPPRTIDRWLRRAADMLNQFGAVVLSPLAFVWGLLGLHRPLVLLKQVVRDGTGAGTQAFSLIGSLLIAGTAAYFIFERMPKPEIVEPLLLPELMAVTGHTLVRLVLPLGACGLVTTKLGAAQAARLAAAVRGGLLETLALAGWRIEAYALVPAVLAQFLAMALATIVALGAGVLLAAVVYVAGHEGASLPLTVNLMIDGLEQAPDWPWYLWAKIGLSSFLGGTIAALCGSVPSRADDDVARAVHRTLLWSVLAVIACQCGLILAEFANW
ncbi:MAG: ATP-binding cassette domain-containing protein [Pirellulales bacterium]